VFSALILNQGLQIVYNSGMFLKRYQRVFSYITMIVMLFASIAPSVSHALAKVAGERSFIQEVCNSKGEKVVIQVTTTMGKQLSTEFPVSKDSNKSNTAEHHFKHCPFCLNPGVHGLAISNTSEALFIDSGKSFFKASYLAPILSALLLSAHPSRAPPSLV